MKHLLGIVALSFLVGCSTVTPSKVEAEAPGFFSGGYKVGDPVEFSSFCVSEEGMLYVVATMIAVKNTSNEVPIVPGCYSLRQQPGVLVQKLVHGIDWEEDPYEVWVVRNVFRKNVYVVFWERPSGPIPPIFTSI